MNEIKFTIKRSHMAFSCSSLISLNEHITNFTNEFFFFFLKPNLVNIIGRLKKIIGVHLTKILFSPL